VTRYFLRMANETTLILLKPDCVEKNLSGNVLGRFQDKGLTIRGIKMMTLSNTFVLDAVMLVSCR
jgi:nucleoside-diphosphate kinase